MKKQPFLPENSESRARYAFLIVTALAAAHFIAVPYYLYLGWTTKSTQFYALAAISSVLGIVIGFGAALSRRGQAGLGLILALGAMVIGYPPASATLVSGLGLVLGIALMAIGPMSAFQVLPGKLGRMTMIITFLSGLATLLLDVFGPNTRPALPGSLIQILAISMVAVTIFFIARQSRRIRSNASYKLIAAVVFVLVIIAGFQILFSDRSTRQNIQQEAKDVLVSYSAIYETKVETEALAAESLAISIASRKDVQDLYSSGDRNGLYELLSPMFAQWQDRQIVHLYIENPDGTVFLRVHNPENFGDDILYRGTANTALQEKRTTSGVEIGPNRLGVRGVAPMFNSDGQFIGLTEVGVDFDRQFIENLKTSTGADYTLWVLHDVAAIPNLKPEEGVPAAPIEEIFFYASTHSESLPINPDIYRSVLKTGEPAFQVISQDTPVPSTVYITPLLGYNGKVLGLLQISEPYTSQLQAQNSALLNTIAVTSGLTILGLFLIWLFSNRVVIQPLNLLSQFAIRQLTGDTSTRVSIGSGDQFQQLAETFNRLADSVEQERQILEQRVAERTSSLVLAAEVGRSVSKVSTLDAMLTDAAELIRTQFDLYYVQVYLVNSSQTYLNLQAGTGHVGKELLGRSHRLPHNTASINGRAAIEKRSVVISDTTASASFKPNPLLPHTRSEMAVPLMIGQRVVGVLDMQSENAGSLNQDVLAAFEALAGQLAIAIQNANFLAETQQARAEVEAQARRLTRSNWVDYLDAIHKPEETGVVFEQNKVIPLAEETEIKENAIITPITLTGESLGRLVVELEGQSPVARTDELLNAVARQVSQQIESLRLLDSAERYRLEAEEASRRLTREGWKSYADHAGESLGYVYDLKEVRLQNHNGDRDAEATGYVLPLKVRDETIGKLVVQGMEAGDGESLSLAAAVAERLGAHIESLRQFEETQRGQMELDKRARQLAAVANVSSVSSRELDIQKMLESVVYLTQRQFGLYHAHVFTYNNQTEMLRIAACGWKEGDEHEGTHGTATIPLAQEKSLVARAARTRQAVIVNDVRNEPGWLPNPLLPDSNSELAVPLIIGDEILGVLDVQSDSLNAFSEEDANIYTTLASQISTSLQNAQSFVQARKQAERESTLNIISQKIQSATTVEAVLQIAARELGHTLGASLTIAQLGLKES